MWHAAVRFVAAKLNPQTRAALTRPLHPAALASVPSGFVFTPPEATNTGPGFNRGAGGGARGSGLEERVGAHARKEWVVS